jgi:hypothetical protein
MLDIYPFHNFYTLAVLNQNKKRYFYNASEDRIINLTELNLLKKKKKYMFVEPLYLIGLREDIIEQVMQLSKMLKGQKYNTIYPSEKMKIILKNNRKNIETLRKLDSLGIQKNQTPENYFEKNINPDLINITKITGDHIKQLNDKDLKTIKKRIQMNISTDYSDKITYVGKNYTYEGPYSVYEMKPYMSIVNNFLLNILEKRLEKHQSHYPFEILIRGKEIYLKRKNTGKYHKNKYDLKSNKIQSNVKIMREDMKNRVSNVKRLNKDIYISILQHAYNRSIIGGKKLKFEDIFIRKDIKSQLIAAVSLHVRKDTNEFDECETDIFEFLFDKKELNAKNKYKKYIKNIKKHDKLPKEFIKAVNDISKILFMFNIEYYYNNLDILNSLF